MSASEGTSRSVIPPPPPPPVKVCTDFPPIIDSNGLWNTSESWKVNSSNPFLKLSGSLHNYTMPVLELEMTLIFLVTQFSHYFFKKLGLPLFAAQLLAGVVLGDAGLGRVIQSFKDGHDHSMNPIFPYANQDILNTLSMFGYTLTCFMFGVKLDLGLISKVGKKALYTSITALVAPLVAGVGTLMFLQFKFSLQADQIVKISFVISIHFASVTANIARLLDGLKIVNSELGRLAVSSAMIGDIAGMALVIASISYRVIMRFNLFRGAMELVVMAIYTVFVIFVGRPIMFWIIKQTPQGKPVKDSYIFLIFTAILWSGLLSHWCHMTTVFGPIFLGLAVPGGQPLGATLVKQLDFMVDKVFMPVFVTTAMMRVSTSVQLPQAHRPKFLATVIVTIAMSCAKFLGCLVTALCYKMPAKDSVALALIMNTKGIVDIAVYTIARDARVIDDTVFTHMMFLLVMSTIAIPLLLKLVYDPNKKYAGYEKRSLMSNNSDSELRILACINRVDNTPAIINLLDASCPTRDRPIAIYVLHLVELVAKTSPILITHDLQNSFTSSSSSYCHSENLIFSFSRFQKDNEGAISVQLFTAMSQPEYMYDDICTVAIDKVASLIILPFHRKWSSTNSSVIVSENENTRVLNCRVLDTAPCSVGILVNRGHIKCIDSSVSPVEAYRVALIFFGGNDDREALTFAKRMVKDKCVSVTVVRFMDGSKDGELYDRLQWVQDNELLKEVQREGAGCASYVEVSVEDGSQTTKKIRSLIDEDEYDLFIVGRRYNVKSPQTMGLEKWSEFPELGVIGDMLSSPESCCKSSVLVIQQQLQRGIARSS